MNSRIWTNEKIELLEQLYPYYSNEYVACELGVCVTSVKKMAKSLGLSKGQKEKHTRMLALIKEKHGCLSHQEMADIVGVSRQTISHWCSSLDLHRTAEAKSEILSRRRNEIIRREKRRIIFGFDQLTNIKVVTSKPRIRLRSLLRNRGYKSLRGDCNIYFNDYTNRSKRLEEAGKKLGLSFYPENKYSFN